MCLIKLLMLALGSVKWVTLLSSFYHYTNSLQSWIKFHEMCTMEIIIAGIFMIIIPILQERQCCIGSLTSLESKNRRLTWIGFEHKV